MNDDHTQQLKALIDQHDTVTVVQADNPDGDSLGASVVLDEVLSQQGKTTHQYCAIDMPKYLRYISGWERVTNDFPAEPGLVIVVDCSVERLLEKPIEKTTIAKQTVVAIDHHDLESNITFAQLIINQPEFAATTHLVYDFVTRMDWRLTPAAAEATIHGINSDTLGLVSPTTSSSTIRAVADIVEKYNVSLHELDAKRREQSRKPLDIINYKAKLIERTEYLFDDQVALIVIPLEEIKEYSDRYNPSVLASEELRNAETVRLSIALKVYEDRITGRLREIQNAPICAKLAESFEIGGGHPFASGFKVMSTELDAVKREVVTRSIKLLQEYDAS